MSERCMENKNARMIVSIISAVLAYFVLCVMVLIMIVPIIYAISTSLSGVNEIYRSTYKWYWHDITFESYRSIFNQYNLVRGFFNTLCYIIPPIGVGMFFSALAAFSFAKLDFPGKNIAF